MGVRQDHQTKNYNILQKKEIKSVLISYYKKFLLFLLFAIQSFTFSENARNCNFFKV